MPRFNVRDNITVIAIFLNSDADFNGDFGARSNFQTPLQFSYSSSQVPSGGDDAASLQPPQTVFQNP
jgi:hypothetical protein